MHLSKSKYCLLCQCPKLLWLDANHPELRTQDGSLDNRMTAGNEIGDLAMGLFGDYTEVTVLREDGSPDIPAMLENTRKCMEGETDTICEASFCSDGLYCAVDILRRQDDGYAIYEVKSSTHVQPQYCVDIAYQKYVLEKCGVTVADTYLVCIDPNYVRGDELDIHALFQIADVAEAVQAEYVKVEANLASAAAVLSSREAPGIDIGEHCDNPYHCSYWEHCSAHLPKPSVFDLYRMSAKKKFEHYRKGCISYPELLENCKLNDKQKRQVQHAISDCPAYIDAKGIQSFLDTLSYPLYFLDFETMQPAIPIFPGTKPYAQIPFQYSLHSIEAPGAELKHSEFLAVSGEDPRRSIAERLCRDIPMNACVTAYNKSFECSRLKELAEQFPDLAEHLLNIQENIRDLLTPFQSGCYYNRAMGGSFSIKSVLPALYPDDPALDYHHLEGVHNGSEAMAVFPQIQNMAPEDQETVRNNLLKYCELDTYAMVKVWEALIRAVE